MSKSILPSGISMRWSAALAAICGCLVSNGAAQVPGSRLDVDGLDRFWPLHDLLRRDEEPSEAQWQALWSTPGYALLDAKERRRPALTQAFRLAYKPSLRDSLASALSGTGWIAYVLPHIQLIPSQREGVSRFIESLAASDQLSRARDLAGRYLPAGVTDRYPAPATSLLYFIDARGYPERLLLDPLFLMSIGDPIELLAHEFHHHYRSHLQTPTRPFGSDLLAWVLSTTESEGIAGLLDKADVPTLAAGELQRRYGRVPGRLDYFKEYQIEYRRADARLRQVEDVLVRVATNPDSTEALGRWLHGDLPDNGRILGAFMAAVIEARLGRERLVSVVGKPFEFWRLYGQAATGTTHPRGLGERALASLDRIETRYRY